MRASMSSAQILQTVQFLAWGAARPRRLGMNMLFACALALGAAMAGAANADGLFAQQDPSSPAAFGLNLVGGAIVLLAGAGAAGALIAAMWVSVRHRVERHRRIARRLAAVTKVVREVRAEPMSEKVSRTRGTRQVRDSLLPESMLVLFLVCALALNLLGYWQGLS